MDIPITKLLTSWSALRWAWIATALIAAVIALLNRAKWKNPRVPIIFSEIKDDQERKSKYLYSPRETLNAGYKKFGDTIWGLDTSQGVKLVLPTTYLDELKSHPALSFTESISHDAMKGFTGIGGLPDDVIQIFKAKFNPSIGAYLPYLQQIFESEMGKVFPLAEEWTETLVYEKATYLVGIASTRAFYSEAASQDKAWLELLEAYVGTVLDYIQALKPWPEALRPFVRFFLSERTRLVKQWNQAHDHLSATLRDKVASGVCDDPRSLLDHIVDARPTVKVDELIYTQMALVVAGIHTTAAAITQLLFDMAAHSERTKELRDEVNHVFDGQWTKQTLGQLRKLDSWMKESQRMSSADLTTFQRRAVESLKLKFGLPIPQGNKIEVPTAAIHFDDTYFPNASTFQPLRYHKKRKSEPSKNQYISTGKNDLSWGYGRHACPGRFFADVEIKIFMADFIRRWDVKLKDGSERPRNLEFETNVIPGPKADILIKRV